MEKIPINSIVVSVDAANFAAIETHLKMLWPYLI